MRIFLDTNVLVSAFMARGLCSDLLRLVLSEHTLVCGDVVIAELKDVLSRKTKLGSEQIEAIESFLRDQPVTPRPTQHLQLNLIDPDDEWVVASAVLCQADLLVTGDQGLLACLDPPLPLLTPRQCWTKLRDPNPIDH